MRKTAAQRAVNRLKKKRRKEEYLQAAKEAEVDITPSGKTKMQRSTIIGEASIAEIFTETVSSIRNEMGTTHNNESPLKAKHNSPVDIKLEFRSLDLKRKGLIFKSEQKESSISLQLMTRILPEE